MKQVELISTAALLLLLGFTVPAGAQPNPQEKPQKQEETKPARQQQQAKPVARQQQVQAAQQRQTVVPQQRQTAFSQHPQRTSAATARQRAMPALHLSVRGNGRIPDDRFRSISGRSHVFHMGSPVMVGGYSRFQYGGYWFGFVQPWPAGWYYTDNVYIDYVDGGYYLYDPYYPDARFAITVVL
jgi:hypothetical protein